MAKRPPAEFMGLGDGIVIRLRSYISSVRAIDVLAPITIVTPSFLSSFFLRRACAPDGLFNVEFLRIDDIAERLAGPTLTGRRPLNTLEAAQIVRAASAVLTPNGDLARAKDHHTFHEALHRTLRDLQLLGDRNLTALPGVVGYGEQLAAVAVEYANKSRDYYDRSTVGEAAASAIRSDPLCLLPFGHIAIVLADMPAPQYRPVYLALINADGVQTLCAVTGDDASDSELAEFVGVTHSSLQVATERDAGNTVLVSAPDRASEVDWVVSNIVELARNGTRLGQVAVFYADSSYGIRVEDALQTAGVATSGRGLRTLGASPEGRFVAGLFKVIDEDLSREAVSDWLTSAPLSVPGEQRPVPANRWDAISRAAGVVRGTAGATGWERRMSKYIDTCRARSLRKYHDESSEAAAKQAKANAESARALIEFIGQLRKAIDRRPSAAWKAHVDWLRGTIERFMLVSATNGDDRQNPLDVLLTRIAELDDLRHGEAADWQTFVRVLTQELERPAGQTHSLGRGVFIGHLSEATATYFEAVHIVGMAEGNFPSGDNPDPLLPDSARRELDPAGTLLPRREQRRARQLRQYWAACASGRRLYMLRPRAQPGAARESGPARWYVDMARNLLMAEIGESTLSASRLDEVLSQTKRSWFKWLDGRAQHQYRIVAPSDTYRYGLKSLAAWSASGRPVSGHRLASDHTGQIPRGIAVDAVRSSSTWSEWDGNLTARFQLGMPAAAHGIASATSYQQWAACPFRYLLSHVLEVAETDRPEEILEIEPMDYGTLVHEILEEFVRGRSQNPTEGLNSELQRLESIINARFSLFADTGQAGSAALLDIRRRQTIRQLGDWLRQDHEMRHRLGISDSLTEVRFGFGEAGLPPVFVELPDGSTIAFRGEIDRLDVSADGQTAYVFDYKTGSTVGYKPLDKTPSSTNNGKLLQLPIYALGARNTPQLSQVEKIRAAYWFVAEPAKDAIVPDLDKFDESASEQAMKASVAAIHVGIRDGIFPARPGGSDYIPGRPPFDNCSYCPYDRVCPTRRDDLWERKRESAPLARYKALAEPPAAAAEDKPRPKGKRK